MWFRMVSDLDLPYQLHDLLPRGGKYLCVQCSNTTQEPVFHMKASECPRATMPVDLSQQRATLAEPDPARIRGPQLIKKRKGADAERSVWPKQAKCSSDAKVGTFPCRSAFCNKLHYTTAGGANRHMLAEHALDVLLPSLMTASPSVASRMRRWLPRSDRACKCFIFFPGAPQLFRHSLSRRSPKCCPRQCVGADSGQAAPCTKAAPLPVNTAQ